MICILFKKFICIFKFKYYFLMKYCRVNLKKKLNKHFIIQYYKRILFYIIENNINCCFNTER